MIEDVIGPAIANGGHVPRKGEQNKGAGKGQEPHEQLVALENQPQQERLDLKNGENEVTLDESGLWKSHFPLAQDEVQKVVGHEGQTIRQLGEDSGTNIAIVRMVG